MEGSNIDFNGGRSPYRSANQPARPVSAVPKIQPRPVSPQPPAQPAYQPPAAAARPLRAKGDNPFAEFLKAWWWKLLIILAILAALGTAGYFAYGYFSASNQGGNGQGVKGASSASSIKDVKSLLAEIKTHIMLPDEQPEVATISDIEVLKGRDFFKNAQNGDAVLIFRKSGRGLIYRLQDHMIIEYTKVEIKGPINP